MSTRKKGYAGLTGLYLPAESCHINDGPSSLIIQGNPIEKQWPIAGVKMHCLLKNFSLAPSGRAGSLLTFGSYTANRALAFSVYCWQDGEIQVEITSTTPNRAGYGKFYIVSCRAGNVEGKIVDTQDHRTIYSDSTPQEIEARLENGLFDVVVDGKAYISGLDIASGSFNGSEATYPIYPTIFRASVASYDLVDFTYETSETSCRFVPMKTADGKDAIYEVYSQQVVEI